MELLNKFNISSVHNVSYLVECKFKMCYTEEIVQKVFVQSVSSENLPSPNIFEVTVDGRICLSVNTFYLC